MAWCAGVGAITGSVVALFTAWELAVLIGWIVSAVSLLVSVWSEIWPLDASATARVATREDDSRTAARVVIVVASLVSLIAVVAGLHRAKESPIELQVALTIAAMGAVIASWLASHTVFILRYAHLFYNGPHVGGIDFPGGDAPSYHDFAYLGFTIGMTFQVSDTAITDRAIRATVLRHALLSFVFGTAIIASTINVVAGLVR